MQIYEGISLKQFLAMSSVTKGSKVSKPQVIAHAFTATGVIFGTFATLPPLCLISYFPFNILALEQDTCEHCQVPPDNILAAIMPAICSNPVIAKSH